MGGKNRKGKEEIGRGRRKKEGKRGDVHNGPTNRPRLRERGREGKGIFDTEPQITDFLSISLSIFPASDLPVGKLLSHDFVYIVSEIEQSYDFFNSFVSGLLQILEELTKNGN